MTRLDCDAKITAQARPDRPLLQGLRSRLFVEDLDKAARIPSLRSASPTV